MSDNSTLVSRLEKIVQRFEDHISKLESKNNVKAGGVADQDRKSADSTTVEVGESNHV